MLALCAAHVTQIKQVIADFFVNNLRKSVKSALSACPKNYFLPVL